MKKTPHASLSGLDDVIAGETAICSVSDDSTGLMYRGYDIHELTEKTSFEEVAYLLIYGELPTSTEFQLFQTSLQRGQGLSNRICTILEQLPKTTHPMDVLRTAVSALGAIEPELNRKETPQIASRLMPFCVSVLLYWYHFHLSGKKIVVKTGQKSLAGHFLNLLSHKPPVPLSNQALNVSLILYAEHEFNASTFAARVCTSTDSDFYSGIVAAIGTLRGPLHGGANEAAMELINRFHTPPEAEKGIREALANKELIMGFGHRVYKNGDPRTPIIKALAKKLHSQKTRCR